MPLDPKRDRFLAKVALEEGFLTKEQIREALRLQEDSALAGEGEELARILTQRGLLTPADLRRLQVRVKEKYFAKLYRKIKAGEGAGGEGTDEEASESPASPQSETGSTLREEEGKESVPAKSPTGRRPRVVSTTRKRRGGRARRPRRGALVGVVLLGVALAVALLLLFVLVLPD